MTRAFYITAPDLKATWFWLLAAGVMAAPLSSKLAGALWLGLCAAAVWTASRKTVPKRGALRNAALLWLLACCVALVAAVAARYIWGDAWDELHAPIRLLLAAAAGLALAGSLNPDQARYKWLAHALTLACCGAVVLACLRFESRVFPTNAIAWAVSVSFFVCLLLPRLNDRASLGQRAFWALGIVAGVLAVLLSQSRGAYGLLLWVGWYGTSKMWKSWASRSALSLRSRVAAAVGGCLVTFAVLASTLGSKMEMGARELAEATTGQQTKQRADSSIGARIYLWRIAAQGFAESPLIGIGGQERLRRIRESGDRFDSPTMRGLGHMHSEYFQAAVDHGLLGLASVLTLIVGLAITAARLARVDSVAGWQLGGIAFMHATASLTNVNTAHNYYGAMFATCVLLAFMSARPPGTQAH